MVGGFFCNHSAILFFFFSLFLSFPLIWHGSPFITFLNWATYHGSVGANLRPFFPFSLNTSPPSLFPDSAFAALECCCIWIQNTHSLAHSDAQRSRVYLVCVWYARARACACACVVCARVSQLRWCRIDLGWLCHFALLHELFIIETSFISYSLVKTKDIICSEIICQQWHSDTLFRLTPRVAYSCGRQDRKC